MECRTKSKLTRLKNKLKITDMNVEMSTETSDIDSEQMATDTETTNK